MSEFYHDYDSKRARRRVAACLCGIMLILTAFVLAFILGPHAHRTPAKPATSTTAKIK